MFCNIPSALYEELKATPPQMYCRQQKSEFTEDILHFTDIIRSKLQRFNQSTQQFQFIDKLSDVSRSTWDELESYNVTQPEDDSHALIYSGDNISILMKFPIKESKGNNGRKGEVHAFFLHHYFSNFVKDSVEIPVNIIEEMADKTLKTLQFPCGEAAFQALKAAKYADWGAFKKIYYAAEPMACKLVGNEVKGFDKDEWENEGPKFMQWIFRCKLNMESSFKTCVGSLRVVCHVSKADHIFSLFVHEVNKKERENEIWATGHDMKKSIQVVIESKTAFSYEATLPFKGKDMFGMCFYFAQLATLVELDLTSSPKRQVEDDSHGAAADYEPPTSRHKSDDTSDKPEMPEPIDGA